MTSLMLNTVNVHLPSLRVSERLDDIHAAYTLPFHLFAVLLEIPQIVRENPRLWHKGILGRMTRRHPMTNLKKIL